MTKKRREETKKFSKLIMVQLISASLIFSPVAFATQVEKNNWVNTTSNLLNQVTGTITNYQGMMASAQQRQGLNDALQINVRYDSVFNCPMAEAISQFPEGYCQTPLQANEVEVSKWIGNKAADRLDFYDQLLNKVQQPPVGIKCMEMGQKMQADDFQRKLNQIKVLISNIKEEDELFKRMLTEKKKGMQALYGEIYGQAKGSGNLSEATNNYTEAFKNIGGCSSVMTTAKLGIEGRKGGLNAIREFMNTPGKGGKSVIDRTYAINDGTIERDLNSQISKLRSKIEKDGIDDFSSTNYRGSGYQFKKMDEIFASKTNEINKKKNELQTLLQSVGSSRSVPDFDENFADRISILQKEATTKFKDQLIDACARNPEYAGISSSDIIGGIRMKDGGDTLRNYKRAYADIYENPNLSLAEKLNQINDLTQRYKGAGLYVKTGNQKYRPNDILAKLIDTCKEKYDQGYLKAADQETFKRKIELIEKSVSEVKTMESSFIGNLSQALKDEIINCTDSKMESVGGCTEDALNPESNSNFCLKSASTCAQQVGSCLANVDNLIQDRTNKLNKAATNYNALVQQHINKRKQQLAQTAQYAFLNAEWLTNFFKGSAIKVPTLNIKMPEKALDTSYTQLQLDLFGGGKMDFLDPTSPSNLVSQLNELEKSLVAQQKSIQADMKKHIAEETTNLKSEKVKWKKIIDDCDGALAAYDQMAQQQYAQQMEQQQEFIGKADAFCRKYTRVRTAGPGPGCEDDVEDLVDDMNDVVGALDSSVNNNLATMKSTCRQINNEQNDLEFDDSVSAISSLCSSEGSEEAILEMIKTNLIAYVPGLELDKIDEALESDDYTSNQKRAMRQYRDMKKNIEALKERDSYDKLREKLAGYTFGEGTPGSKRPDLPGGESTDLCQIMKNRIVIDAVQKACVPGTACLTSDIEDKVTEYSDSKDHPSGYNGVGNQAKTLVSLAVSPSWSDFGEIPQGDCFAQDNSMRMGENGYNPASSIPGLENLGGGGSVTN